MCVPDSSRTEGSILIPLFYKLFDVGAAVLEAAAAAIQCIVAAVYGVFVKWSGAVMPDNNSSNGLRGGYLDGPAIDPTTNVMPGMVCVMMVGWATDAQRQCNDDDGQIVAGMVFDDGGLGYECPAVVQR